MIRPEQPPGARHAAEPIAEHVRNVVHLVGVEHVAFGSELDGPTMPDGV
jgi:microsomal dipeptidase-like Zn-dependent dipeptidase